MNNTESQKIVLRFFRALDILRDRRVITYAQFCADNGINRGNLYALRAHPEKGYFQAAWLAALVDRYNVRPMWILCGRGDIFQK